jgi:hypothetical protein
MHTPVEITELAVAKVRSLGADCTIALGGGSTTGLGKAIALRTDLPQIVIPTTYAGSEMTSILGETQFGKRRRSMRRSIFCYVSKIAQKQHFTCGTIAPSFRRFQHEPEGCDGSKDLERDAD